MAGQGLDKKNSHGFENIYMGGGRGEQWNACMFLQGDLSKTSTVRSHFVMQKNTKDMVTKWVSKLYHACLDVTIQHLFAKEINNWET